MTTNISRETGRLSLLLRSPAKFEPYALPSPPLSLFSILDEDFIQVSYSDLLSASWQRDDAAWQYVKIITSARLFTEEKNKKKKRREGKERNGISIYFFFFPLIPIRANIYFSSPFRNSCVFHHPILRGKRFDAEQSTQRAKLSSAPASLE